MKISNITTPQVTVVKNEPDIDVNKLKKELIKTSKNQANDPEGSLTVDEFNRNLKHKAGGMFGGVAAATLLCTTGANTWLHEVGGHAYLGGGLTQNYPNGIQLEYQVDGIDNFNEMKNAKTIQGKLVGLGHWLTAYDANKDGYSGWDNPWASSDGPNALGKHLGDAKRNAWISLSGSMPGLFLNSLAVMGGMQIKDKHPAAGYALMTTGMTLHLMSSAYPISAAVMTNEQIIHTAQTTGHDFANFAYDMSKVTNIHPQGIAIATAAIYTGIVPAVALGMYLYQKSHKTDIVPDYLALEHWLSKSVNDPKIDEKFMKLYKKYPHKEDLQKAVIQIVEIDEKYRKDPKSVSQQQITSANQTLIEGRKKFNNYLINKLDKNIIEQNKNEVLEEWHKLQKSDKVQQLLEKLSIAGMVGTSITPVVNVLGKTIAPALGAAGTALTYASPALAACGTVKTAYDTYKDLKSPDTKVPKSAKAISIAQTVTSAVGVTTMAISLLVPPAGMLLIPALLVTTAAGLVLSIAKNNIIKKNFYEQNGLEPPKPNFIVRGFSKVKDFITDHLLSKQLKPA